ncbi:MAG TPA: glycosyltransferase family 4 protein [Solirubrobacteraceae bacterium]|jgi:glycosyltransferase involved in cell wall biosynthesis|nr:glycosyltransferase family 4 protein [Solirubrobacteraceae bacterium]
MLAVCATAHLGGAEAAMIRLMRRLDWDMLLCAPEDGPLDAAGFPWARLAVGGLGRGEGARAVGAWPRARYLARGRDVVYLNGTICGRLLPALVGKRTVLHVHDIVDRVPAIWRLADVVLAASQAVADHLEPLDAKVVYCPIESDPGECVPPWPGGPGPIVAFVGRIEPRKGPLDLIRAAPAIKAGAPGARVVLIGSDPFGSDPGYVAAVRAAGEVEHYGWVENGAALMRHIDVLVAPSYQEPFGTVLSEAMAVGTPVVATRVGGLAEVVEDGVTGRLVDPGRPDQLAAAVLDVLARRESMGAAARVAAGRFDADLYAARVERLIAPPGKSSGGA